MIDINNELFHIQNGILGEEVRSAVVSALDKVATGLNTDITFELAAIADGRYGANIRQAIYDSLNKLSKATPTPMASDFIAGLSIPMIPGLAVCIYGEDETEEEE